jgi:hypothetical protein
MPHNVDIPLMSIDYEGGDPTQSIVVYLENERLAWRNMNGTLVYYKTVEKLMEDPKVKALLEEFFPNSVFDRVDPESLRQIEALEGRPPPLEREEVSAP